MKRSLSLGAALLVALVVGCGSSKNDTVDPVDPDPDNDEDAAPDPDDPDPSLRFAPDLDSAMQGVSQAQYSILDQRDIVAVVAILDAAGVHFLRLDITQPNGTPYATIWRAYSTDADAPAMVNHPTLGESMDVERVTAADGLSKLYIGIPIAGTDITRFGITGVFSVDTRLEGNDTSIATGSFELVQ